MSTQIIDPGSLILKPPAVHIHEPVSRWHQDIEVHQFIEHLDQPEKRDRWDLLTKSEIGAILKELDRCRKDFVYAARNYFWITNKKRQEMLFALWPGQELILQKMLELKGLKKPQKIVIVKARQLGCSTLIEALIAWRTMFFSGVNALVSSYDQGHAAKVLFPIMCFILDRMPWWLQPKISNRKAEEGIFFENKDYKLRGTDPGINSTIFVKGATSTTGVGMGIRLAAVHISEYASFDDATAREIIDQDMGNALVEDEDTFAILESTAKGANRYAHKMWKKNVELLAHGREEWYPLFLPWFFESTRVRPVVTGWKPQPQENRMRERVASEWVRCDNPHCRQYHQRHIKGFPDRNGNPCVTCNTGTMLECVLTDQQLAWMEHRRENAAKDDDSLRKLKQEQAASAEEAFVLSGIAIFPDAVQDFAASCVRPPIAYGDFDNFGRFHGLDTRNDKHYREYGWYPCFCEDCNLNHTLDECPCQIWEWPEEKQTYSCGADIGEGLGGRNCYSVGTVWKISKTGGRDFHVATWRSNTITPLDFAGKLNCLGRYYNDCMMAPECNKYDMVVHTLRMQYCYPNIYRWKHLDSINTLSQKLGWWTSCNSRPRLYITLRRWLQQEQAIIRSANAIQELKNFSKEDDESTNPSGDQDEFDDELISLMIGLYCAHEDDYSEAMGSCVPRDKLTIENSVYRITCNACGHMWPSDEVMSNRISYLQCERCQSRAVSITRNPIAIPPSADNVIEEIAGGWTPESEWAEYGKGMPDYSIL
jgi:hypothetical protein